MENSVDPDQDLHCFKKGYIEFYKDAYSCLKPLPDK